MVTPTYPDAWEEGLYEITRDTQRDVILLTHRTRTDVVITELEPDVARAMGAALIQQAQETPNE